MHISGEENVTIENRKEQHRPEENIGAIVPIKQDGHEKTSCWESMKWKRGTT
jgi:hypothetical protein